MFLSRFLFRILEEGGEKSPKKKNHIKLKNIEKQNGVFYDFKLKIARFLVFSKWKSALGGKLELICSGSAPLQPRLAKIFTAAGIQIMEGYGLTESSPVISISESKKGGTKISCQSLISLSNQDQALIVDLRSSEAFNSGHITASINIPVNDVSRR